MKLNSADEFDLPVEFQELLIARDRLKTVMNNEISASGSQVNLRFTLDGNLVGDMGEALAVKLFGIQLVETRSHPGIDGYTVNRNTVQVKATGTSRGAAFRPLETHADYLLVFDLDFTNRRGRTLFNGPERYVRKYLPENFSGQRSVSLTNLLKANDEVQAQERLQRIA